MAAKNLLIVESPAKARTLEKYLGPDFAVLACYGHVRDLIPKEGAVDPDNDFAMNYQVIERNEKHVNAIARAVRKAEALYLATDPDREGEAIAWHLCELLTERGLLDEKAVYRVAFDEITKSAVTHAVNHPRRLSNELVDAQQARRALDYLVGFNLSPLLWKKVRPGLSAGRVQSPALRLIVEREEEIEAFERREYWTIDADADKDGKLFAARLVEFNGEKIEQFTFTREDDARAAERALLDAAQGVLTVAKVEKKERRRNPASPFTTSTLQQEASRKLRFGAQRTMRIAQKLYEGIDVGDGSVGLISYMRTDSVSLAREAIEDIRATIQSRYGAASLPDKPRFYKTKAKNAQEAHEAIRPTSTARTPEDLARRLDADQLKLYTLIWQRTVACQMTHAVFDTVTLDLLAGPDGEHRHRFRANGSTLKMPGFIAVYQEGRDDREADEDAERILPTVSEGERLGLAAIRPEQHFTEPPPRFSEASLVKALEEFGIGRPSTYASIISTLQNREYVEMDARRFFPTDIGRIVNNFLTRHFTRYVDYDFTARMEDALDAISRGEKDWKPLMKGFWEPFSKRVKEKEVSVSREEVAQARELGTDPVSGRPVSVRMGRYGPFVQIGTKDDEEKPKFAGLRPGQKMDGIDLAGGLELFKLPRELGMTPNGEPVSASIGRFGPYVKYGDKFVSMRDDDPYTVDLDRALELIRAKQELDAKRLIRDFPEAGIQILNGRYGPYITDKTKNARIPKDRDPKSLSLEECRTLLEQAPARGQRRGGTKVLKKKAAARKKPAGRKTPAGRKKKAGRKSDPGGRKTPVA
ncbi:MAG: DNA topoisomerase I [Gammaproteobacteria bacterium]|nr:DNA topoisomerase I [Gammaproteobacteria bacterium]